MQVRILDRNWLVEFTNSLPEDVDGECDPPCRKKKKIKIRPDLSSDHLLRVAIHEMLHAADFWKSEEWVDQTSADLAVVLSRLGYKKG